MLGFPHFASYLHDVVGPSDADRGENKGHVDNGLPHHARLEPPRIWWRLFGLSQAAKATCVASFL